MSRRTETSYKAERLGKTAQHVEAQDSSRTVNDAVVQLQFTFLSGEIWSTGRSPQCIDDSATLVDRSSYSAVSSTTKESADGGNIVGDGPEVSRGHSRCRICRALDRQRETRSGHTRPEAATALKDRTLPERLERNSSWRDYRRPADRSFAARWPEKSLKPRRTSCSRRVSFGSASAGNRRMRTRTYGGVGAGS